jgi:redox-sensitive bicupin YhaK (pirin superfamily)
MSAPRSIQQVLPSTRTTEGAGFIVRRPFPVAGVIQLDPFLLLDEMGPIDYAPGQATGAPDHPHRGFETVSYILEGEVEHEDSAGHRGFIGAGDVQWMTAGQGIIHSEMPSSRLLSSGGRVHGFQLWVNLPSRDKMMEPRYQEVPAAKIPKAQTKDGLASVAVIAGDALGVSAVIETRTPIAYHDWSLLPGASVSVALPESFRGFAFVFAGEVLIGGEQRLIKDGQCAVFTEGGPLLLSTKDSSARLLLIAGEPLKEPVARYGPFVMNTQQEIQQAFLDYQAGRLGRISRA